MQNKEIFYEAGLFKWQTREEATKETKETGDIKESKETKETGDIKESKEIKEIRETEAKDEANELNKMEELQN